MSKLAGAVGGPTLGAAAAAALVLGVALIIGPADTPQAPQDEPTGLVGALPQDDAAASDAPEEQAAEQTAEQAALSEPEEANQPAEEAQAETEPQAEEQAEAAPAMPEAPSIDTFRLDPDGALLVAGQATPGWDTVVTLDGAALETVAPDAAGKFVAFLTIEQSDQPRILSLRMRDPEGGAEIASRDEVIIAPTPQEQTEELAALETPEPTQETTGETNAENTDGAQPEDSVDAEAGVQPEADTEMPDTATTAADPASERTEQSQTVLLSNDEGVSVLQPATPRDLSPEVMSSVALDAITYNQEGEVELSGRGQGEGFVRVYLDNAPITSSRIAEDGNWRTDLPEVDTGVYTLRIDETDAEGNVTSRVETPFKREDEDVIASASAAVAEQRIAAVTVQPGSTLWAISRAAYGEGVLYVRVFEANRDRIRDPDLIYPGQVFSLPE